MFLQELFIIIISFFLFYNIIILYLFFKLIFYTYPSIKNTNIDIDIEPFICKLYNQTGYNIEITGGQAFLGQILNPPLHTIISNNSHYDYCLFNTIQLTLKDHQNNILGVGNIEIDTDSSGNNYLLDSNNLFIFTYDPTHSEYPSSNPWDQRHVMDISTPNIET